MDRPSARRGHATEQSAHVGTELGEAVEKLLRGPRRDPSRAVWKRCAERHGTVSGEGDDVDLA